MKTDLNQRNFRHTTVEAETEDVVAGYLEEKIKEYRTASDSRREKLDIQVYSYLDMAFGSDKSAVPYCKSLNYYNEEKWF